MTRWSKEEYERWAKKWKATHPPKEQIVKAKELEDYAEIKTKYGNKKTEIDGIVFDSKKEAERYIALRTAEKVKIIRDLELQPRFELQEGYEINGKKVRKIEYVADFKYFDIAKNDWVVEDVKGHKTEVYKLKKKLFEKKYGIEIREI